MNSSVLLVKMWLCVFLLYSVLQESSGCTVERGLGDTITRSAGDSVELPCSCTQQTKEDPQTVQWGFKRKFIQGDYNADHSVFQEDGSQNQRYRGRVQRLNQNKPGTVALIISHLTEEDEGAYLCGNNRKYNRAVILQVSTGCAVLSDSERTFSRSPGESVLLPCPCPPDQHRINPDRVTWTKDQTAVSNDTESYRGRVWMFDQNHSRNFSLLISDLTKEDSGRYTCRADEKDMPFVLLDVTGCTLSENKQTVPVSRSSGESVLLSCTCTDQQGRPVGVQWRTPNQEDLLQRYSARVQTSNQSSTGNFSVLISDLTEEDGGTYSCWINQNQYRNFSLTVKDCKLSETQEKVIHKYPGESVLLPCACSDQRTTPVSVKWERVDSGRTEVSNEMEPYKGRVQMFNKNLPANLSLLISNLTEQDQGTFRCSINNKHSINITLNIRDCTLSETQEKVIHKYPGESVLLPCTCSDQRTTPVSVKWEHVDSGGTEVSNNTANYTGRVQMFNKNVPANLSLLISNLTEQDQGTYRCSINNKQSINIRLNIKDCKLSETQEKDIHKYPGESVLLPCTCSDQRTIPVSVKWEHVDSGGTEVSNKTGNYTGRVQMFNKNLPANLSLLISNLTEQDQGTYRCLINNKQSINITLNIRDCKLSETQEKDIHKYPGEFVLLPCTCSDQHTKPVSVKWERVDSGRTEVSNEMELYKGRVQMFNRNLPANLSLLISNLTEQDQGTFRCSINNKQSINIRLSIRDCKLSETQEKDIHKYPGESVLLPCSCTDQRTTPVSVKWDHVDSGGTEVSNKMAKYTGRVQMFNKNLPANLSLLISNLTEQDQGTYRCSINNKQSINIRLNIRDCKLSETQEKDIHKYPGDSVLLPCACSDQHTKPISVKWERVDSGGTEVSNETPRYTGRVQMFNKNLPANLSLLISNLTEQDQGTYRCSINNKQSINITLNITDCKLSETQEKVIHKYPGESVLLSCSCSDQRTIPVSVKWEHVDSGGTEVSNKTANYTGRVQMFNKNLPANLSLLISNLTEQDQGTYRCSINNKQSINITLNIKDCKLSETQEKDIHKYPGESVLLPCSCSDQRTIPVSVKWEHVDSGGTEVSKKTANYTGRVQMFNKNLPANLSLLISNLTEQDQGTYRCLINNKQSINIRLNIRDCKLSETQEKVIHKYPGESVLLSCSCSDQRTIPVSVKWERVDSGGTEVSNKTANYTGRVQMFNNNLPANLSLLISNLTEQDQGTYRCSINNKQSIDIRLNIKGCTLSETKDKLIIRSPGDSVLLPCSCTDQQTKPRNVKWERLDSGGTEVLTTNNTGRVQMFNKNLPANLSLLISNLTQKDQGTYRCSINNNQSINITLNITEDTGETVKLESWTLIIIVCALLLILLLLLGGAACTYCKHGKGMNKCGCTNTHRKMYHTYAAFTQLMFKFHRKKKE
uniref:Ig-like domain-containing protein n=1 Tax=Pygocentrus nattereri TaxID=42514 RepID=A0AAR2JMU7_PYGNA